jgi:RNA ligase (TIGR02306 family)
MKLASIEIIECLKDHPNADRLQLATILGWQVVVQKGIHKEKDKVIFIPIDTILPKCEWSNFLVDKENPDKPIRLKMVKLRGEYSAGIIVPLGMFPSFLAQEEIGADIGEKLGIQKYVKELPAFLQGENIGDFPTRVASKTDEDNGLSSLEIVQEVIKNPLTITQKCDGSSCTVIFENGIITEVCSRNLSKKKTENSTFWKVVEKLSKVDGFTGVIQGELCGPGIQKNPLRLPTPELIVFQIKKADGTYMNYQEMKGFCNNELKCNVVPLIEDGVIYKNISTSEVLEKLQEIADDQRYLPANTFAEGIVVRPKDYRTSNLTGRRPLGFKILNRNYKDN